MNIAVKFNNIPGMAIEHKVTPSTQKVKSFSNSLDYDLPKPFHISEISINFNLIPGERMIRLPQNSVCPSTGGKIVM